MAKVGRGEKKGGRERGGIGNQQMVCACECVWKEALLITIWANDSISTDQKTTTYSPLGSTNPAGSTAFSTIPS
jgi:hypothetical protein